MSTFELSKSILTSKGFETLNYEDIKGNDESIQGPSWKDFLTPNKCSVVFDYSSISSLASPADPDEIIKQLNKLKKSVGCMKSLVANGPIDVDETIPIMSSLSDSNDFLRQKTKLALRESVKKSAKDIVDLALTGQSEEGLPDEVTPGLIAEVAKQLYRETKERPSIENLLKFIEIIKEEPNKVPKLASRPNSLEMKLKQSQNEVATLGRALIDCQSQIKIFQEVILESMTVMKEINNRWASEKQEADAMREKLKNPCDEISLLKNALIDCQKQLELEKKNKILLPTNNLCKYSQTDDKFVEDIIEENKQLKLQVKQNLETFDKLAVNLAGSKSLEKSLKEKEKELNDLKKDKQELVEAVEQLVESAQKIMESSKGSKQQKLRMFADMMGSLKSISLSDLQR
jgi:DNA repair exonuclease SbcCD ATPase subunit